MGNPYESPIAPTGKQIAASGHLAISRRPISLWLLLLMFTLTVVMAYINLIQEESGGVIRRDFGSFFFNCVLAVFSGASQLPGLAIATWHCKSSRNSMLPLLCAAYVIALTGMGVFMMVALDPEPADSMNSAAHLHIFLLPALHLGFSFVLYFLALPFTLGIMAYSRYSNRKGNVNESGKCIGNGRESVVHDV